MSNTPGKDLNKEFLEYYLTSSLPTMRVGLIFTLLLFIFFAAFNQVFFPDLPEMKFYMRFGLISPFIIITVIVMYIPKLESWLTRIYIVLNLLICVVILYIGSTAILSQPGYQHFSSWVMLVIIGLFTFYRLRFRTLSILGALMLISYTVSSILNGTYTGNIYFFYNNLFFVIASYSVGFFMAFILERLNWKNFLHQKALSENNKKLLREIQERREAEEAFRGSELQYHHTLDSIPDWIYVMDDSFRILIINSSLKEEYRKAGYPEDAIGKNLAGAYPFITDETLDEVKHVFATGTPLITEQKMEIGEQVRYFENRKIPVFRDNKVIQVMTIIRDRSKEREVEDLKFRNAEQKEIMLREIHHRVKNNLAIVISLLTLQMRNNSDPELRRIIRDIEMRIRSMALIHEHLYRSENIDRIPLDDYLRSLASIIMGTFSGHRVNLITDLEPTEVSIETALPLGLITNELLTNSFKYAFPHHQEGEIQIHLRKGVGDNLTLVVKDNGIGLPANFSMDQQPSLGMFIIRLLIEQLDGKIELSGNNGATFTMQFRNLMPAKTVNN